MVSANEDADCDAWNVGYKTYRCVKLIGLNAMTHFHVLPSRTPCLS